MGPFCNPIPDCGAQPVGPDEQSRSSRELETGHSVTGPDIRIETSRNAIVIASIREYLGTLLLVLKNKMAARLAMILHLALTICGVAGRRDYRWDE